MPPRTPERIDEIIRAKHELGYRPYKIGRFVGKSHEFARQRLLAMGLKPHGKEPNKPAGHVRTLAEIDEFIVARSHCEPSALASRLGIPTEQVRERMIAMGLEVGDGSTLPKFKVHPMWTEFDEDDLREAIWEKQRQGAREARRAHRHSAASVAGNN